MAIRSSLVSMLALALLMCGTSHDSFDSGAGDGGGDVDIADGGCPTACTGGALCCASACVVTATCSFAVTGVSPSRGWESGGDYLQLSGAGFAAGLHVYIGDGRAAVRVIDQAHALVQTPPGPLGSADLKIVLGSASATLKGGFAYQRGALQTPWQQKPMSVVRGEWPAVSVMQDGRVLIAGGATTPDDPSTTLPSGEIFTRSSESVTPAGGTMGTVRWRDAAVTLLTGKVLVVGGVCGIDDQTTPCVGDPTVADLFDPVTSSFAPSKSHLNVPRVHARAVLLPDGRVLIGSNADASLEIYDPDADAFTLVAHTQRHFNGMMVVLRDGRALVLGGSDVTTAEIFDPDTNAFATTGSLTMMRGLATATTLPDGRVLVVGGASNIWTGGTVGLTNSIEAFDPTSGTFALTSYTLTSQRQSHASALVLDGTVLVMGGYVTDCNSLTDTVDQIDPVAGTVTPFATLPNKNTEWNAVRLLDGSVVAVGGGACGTSLALPDLDFLPGDPTPH